MWTLDTVCITLAARYLQDTLGFFLGLPVVILVISVVNHWISLGCSFINLLPMGDMPRTRSSQPGFSASR